MPRGSQRLTTALAVVTALVAMATIAGSTAFAKAKPSAPTSTETSTSDSTVTVFQGTEKVQVCQRTHSKKKPSHTITVSASAVPAHLAHDDVLGACVVLEAESTTSAPTGHGNSANAKGHNK
jgi:hypothetical protein